MSGRLHAGRAYTQRVDIGVIRAAIEAVARQSRRQPLDIETALRHSPGGI